MREANGFSRDKLGIQTSEEYLASLKDGREVWLNGERVHDVVEHPAFRNAALMTTRRHLLPLAPAVPTDSSKRKSARHLGSLT